MMTGKYLAESESDKGGFVKHLFTALSHMDAIFGRNISSFSLLWKHLGILYISHLSYMYTEASSADSDPHPFLSTQWKAPQNSIPSVGDDPTTPRTVHFHQVGLGCER